MLNSRLDRQAPSRRVLAALAVVLLLVTLPVAAVRARQAVPAPLTGTVYDVSGAVLPGVTVSLAAADAVPWTATTSAAGRFEFPTIAPGTYVLEARLTGFRSLRQEVELRDARDWNRAVTLQLGSLSETVDILASRVAPPTAAPASVGPQPVRVGGSIRVPKKIRHVRPTYPLSMRETGHTGTVPLEAVIGTDGSVSSVRVVSAQVHPDLAVAAVDAVRQWLFTPTLLNGEAVEVVMTVTIRFDLEG